jgi:hypothetical protein
MSQSANLTAAVLQRHALAEFAKKLPIRPPPTPRTVFFAPHQAKGYWHEFCIYFSASFKQGGIRWEVDPAET